MKGAVYYNEEEAKRNHAFIDDLLKEAKNLGIELKLITNSPTEPLDFILFRDRDPTFALELEQAGYRVFNRASVQKIANDKLRTFELATLLGIPAVPTFRADQLPPLPFVMKTRGGHGGNEVFLCESVKQTETILNQFNHNELIVQPFIESNATDVRVFMLGNEVLGAVKRTGAKDSFKANYTLGGTVEKYTLNDTEMKQVQAISRAISSDYIGMDFILPISGGWLLNEIEDPVGARSLYRTHEFSVAKKLLEYVKNQLGDESC
ncbi:alpha-L-glutamate ligase [Sporosarcina sp. P12(2017)]|uniref:ATP-grasp domain-containing protein n=1 Tax=unclassified Sporosarcina TaxID=2647733 RepID=UPI000C1695A2|nr:MULTISPECIES: ATP-grasp domain-containing protein [unclassified Sporosarcina]PIC57864.1 alpha-L-glutamate ligase [Sporosarcina sp. P10]PIC61246.1 alpha-L-glutamate ligase [Sporosarcina sp. P12(2017)]